jgi:4-hydroxybenzoate polyprenyltransferase
MPNPLTSALRLQDWWAPKLPVLLAVAYAGLAHRGSDWAFSDLLFPLASIIVGAAYVSLLNDYTDLEADRLAGKANRMAVLPPALRLPLLLAIVALGVGFCIWLVPRPLALAAYAAAWLVFAAYSLPPIRLKGRGFPGVVADAAGAHLFPTLYLYFVTSHLGSPPGGDPVTVVALALWSLALGIRGNLWHQLADRDSDKTSGTSTFGARPDAIKTTLAWTPLFLSLEVGSFIILIVQWQITHIVFIIPFYPLLVWARRRLWRIPTSPILAGKKTRFLFAEIYSTILPWTLLLTIVANESEASVYLLLHLLLFGRSDLATIIEWARLYTDPRWIRAAAKDSRKYLTRLRP